MSRLTSGKNKPRAKSVSETKQANRAFSVIPLRVFPRFASALFFFVTMRVQLGSYTRILQPPPTSAVSEQTLLNYCKVEEFLQQTD
jgi:hypothetical protein